jgi:hypothetical protein
MAAGGQKCVIAAKNGCKRPVFDRDSSWGPKTRENGWKRVLVTKNGRKCELVVKTGSGTEKARFAAKRAVGEAEAGRNGRKPSETGTNA